MKKRLKNISTEAPRNADREKISKSLNTLHEKLFSLQNLFYAEKKHSLLIILQGIDTSGKDGTIRHVFSCTNPQGCRVKSFKTPTEEELLHDFLWRIYPHLPERGMIQIFNRSHYEDIVFPVVHRTISEKEVSLRHKIINRFEEHLKHNNTIILKFFLHISKKEQKKRLDERLKNPEKSWKYDYADKREAKKWEDYIGAYQMMLDGCEDYNPWTIIPSDLKWYRNFLVASKIVILLEQLKMKYPEKKGKKI